MSRITSRGVKCSPAVSLEISANLRISSSKTVPISALLTAFGMQVDVGELLGDQVEQAGLGQPVDLACRTRTARRCRGRRARTPGCRRTGSPAMWSWSPMSVFMSMGEVLKKLCPPCAAGTAPG